MRKTFQEDMDHEIHAPSTYEKYYKELIDVSSGRRLLLRPSSIVAQHAAVCVNNNSIVDAPDTPARPVTESLTDDLSLQIDKDDAKHIAHAPCEKKRRQGRVSYGASRRPSRAVICCETEFGFSLDEFLSETHML